MKGQPRALLLHYLLLGYVVLQFSWWAYLLYDLNVELYDLKVMSAPGSVVDNELGRKLWMILGEGSVFLSLLLFGAFYIRKYLLREQRLAHQERNFLLATTHELNSPLAAVKLNLQTLRRETLNEGQKEQMVTSGLSAVQRLEVLVSNILMASRIDAGKLQLMQEPVSVAGLLHKVSKQLQPLASEQGSQVNVQAIEDYMLQCDAAVMEIVLSNLVQNAIKYGQGSPIELGCVKKGDVCLLWVADEGAGVPPAERQRIFRKFYRIENEETRSQKGTGLGLYLVRELVTLHNGSIIVKENAPKGLRVEITLSNT